MRFIKSVLIAFKMPWSDSLTAIRDVESEFAAMKAEQDPPAFVRPKIGSVKAQSVARDGD